ncbi:MAG: carboxypeptidase-like regulatory domain-containing protein, partial [Candidatus Acidiferrum sp.]
MSSSSVKRNHILLIILCALWAVGNAFAQTGTTSLRGTVADKTGAAIVGANVKISNTQTGF